MKFSTFSMAEKTPTATWKHNLTISVFPNSFYFLPFWLYNHFKYTYTYIYIYIILLVKLSFQWIGILFICSTKKKWELYIVNWGYTYLQFTPIRRPDQYQLLYLPWVFQSCFNMGWFRPIMVSFLPSTFPAHPIFIGPFIIMCIQYCSTLMLPWNAQPISRRKTLTRKEKSSSNQPTTT